MAIVPRDAPPTQASAQQPAQPIDLELPTAFSNAPAPRKRRDLNSAWLTVWSSAAARANDAHASWPFARSSRHAPRPSTMIPMFSIEWKASSRFSSCWKSA
jgi:hypothetical protein